MTTKFLVTGGAGFLGINLCRYLLKKGYDVRSLDMAEFDYPEIDRVEVVTGDIRNEKIVNQALEGIDIVVHCAAALPLYTPEEIYAVDVVGTEVVMKSALKHKVDRAVMISSTAVYGIPDHHPLFEDDRLEGVGPYGEAKILAEKVCEKYRKNGLCVSILRPKSFIGEERLGVFAIYYDWVVSKKSVPIVGNGKNRYQLLDVQDLCEACHLASTLPKEKVNDVFNIGAKKFTTMKEDFGAVLTKAGFGKRIIPTPPKLTILGLRILEKMKLSPLYKWVYETAPEDSFVSIEKAEKVLGFKPKYSTKRTLVKTYEWYKNNYEKTINKTGISHRVPWSQGILKYAKKLMIL
ncbi:MAG: NAD(P)-dependent oxidoreductase [Candidatus Lokiarchaeota archaeon]|nr:NAD(P)-dependent oxidoreductase [Candidatus Lokiarchaeota archaeon]